MEDGAIRNPEPLTGRRAVRTSTQTPLGRWIRRTRFERRLSQGELADRAGLSRSYVCNIERGYDIQPSLRSLHLLATALGVDRREILEAAGILDEPEEGKTDERERRLVAAYRTLGDENRTMLERFATFLLGEERRWSQPRLIGEQRPSQAAVPPSEGPRLFEETLPGADTPPAGATP
jgi:transcriptional regulator with XRE-family HTH domain